MRGATAPPRAPPACAAHFNPRAPCGARPFARKLRLYKTTFQSTRPMRGATQGRGQGGKSRRISIHAPHAGRDLLPPGGVVRRGIFQSTRPMRGATHVKGTTMPDPRISIHAPHAGRDSSSSSQRLSRISYFNPRAPCGARQRCGPKAPKKCRFQSTRPMRGATPRRGGGRDGGRISIHAPHAGRDLHAAPGDAQRSGISIHAPHAGRDKPQPLPPQPQNAFQSTRPMRGATWKGVIPMDTIGISIHAPHAGRDFCPACGKPLEEISIHAPHAGRDQRPLLSPNHSKYFNPRAPCGARPAPCTHTGVSGAISIHAPHAGRDSKTAQFSCAVLRKSNSKYNAADNFQAKYACGIVQTIGTYSKFRCEAPGKSLSACASHSDHQHALRLIAGL